MASRTRRAASLASAVRSGSGVPACNVSMAARGVGVLLDRRPLTPQQPDAAPVERLAPDNRQEPGAKCRLAAETRQLLPGDDKRLLGCVFGVFAGAERRQRGAIHDPLVQADQGAKGVLVPGPRGRDQRRDFRGFPAFVHLRLAGESVTRVATATVTGTVDIRDGRMVGKVRVLGAA